MPSTRSIRFQLPDGPIQDSESPIITMLLDLVEDAPTLKDVGARGELSTPVCEHDPRLVILQEYRDGILDGGVVDARERHAIQLACEGVYA